MTTRRAPLRALTWIVATVGMLGGSTSLAQVTPAAGYTPPDDTPTIKVGVTLFTDYTYTKEPKAVDADGNKINPAAFNVTRMYINVTGNASHNVSFRITPDIKLDSTAGDTLNGSLVYRLKYGYGQFNLDEKWSKGSWVRIGLNQTPYIDWLEGIYRYRFQGTMLVDREGFMSPSDYGLSTHYNLPGNFGDVHAGYYNGETYTKQEANDQKAIQIRATLRPVPNVAVWKGLRLTAFYDGDHYIRNDDRTRFVYAATFEHKYITGGYEHLDATDQSTGLSARVKATGYSVWAIPRSTKGWEGLLRYDSLKPNKTNSDTKTRKIAGVAYWFKTQQAPVSAAVLADYEEVKYDVGLGKPDEKRYAIHTLFNF